MFRVGRLMVNLLETLDGCFSTFFGQEDSVRQSALDLATGLMTGPAPACVQKHAKGLLATLHPSKSSFHSHKASRVGVGDWVRRRAQNVPIQCSTASERDLVACVGGCLGA